MSMDGAVFKRQGKSAGLIYISKHHISYIEEREHDRYTVIVVDDSRIMVEHSFRETLEMLGLRQP